MQLNWLNQNDSINHSLSAGFPDKMVILDCETTGGRAKYHRIIEIGLLVIEDGRLIETWQSFINPETIVPNFIQKLTGIKPNMLNNAPKFSEIADKLHELLENRTLVAHNASFDYSFLKSEFSRIGLNYNAKPLCSVKLSRNLYPQFKRHGLSEIIKRFDLNINNRHRALDDAEMVYGFFVKTSSIYSPQEIEACCQQLLKRTSLPPLLDPDEINNIPNTAGVYYFYAQNGELLYVGKSINLRNRVLSHFSADYTNSKEFQMCQKTAHVNFETTPSDFGAQIRESHQIKALSPLYNRQLRKTRKLYQYKSTLDESSYLRLATEAVSSTDPSEQQFGLFRSPRQASIQLEKLADQYFLCHQLIGLEKTHKQGKPCFRSQLKKCLGACHGAEAPEHYNERLTSAIQRYQIQAWPYQNAIMIEESNPQGQPAFHIIDHWRYIKKLDVAEDIYDLGYQVSNNNPLLSQQSNTNFKADDKFDLDIYFILVRFLINEDNKKMSNLKIWMLDQATQ
ncbi:MAG: exonuclease domain-containing protein [Porticoccaceae bacterium]